MALSELVRNEGNVHRETDFLIQNNQSESGALMRNSAIQVLWLLSLSHIIMLNSPRA